MNYCLADGAPLVDTASEPTLVIPQPIEKKKNRILIWLALTALGVAAVVVVLAAVLIYKFAGDSNAAGVNSQPKRPGVSSSPNPKASPSPIPSPSADGQDKTGDSAPPSVMEDSDEITPILWDTTASGFKGDPGKTYRFQCPPDGTERAVFGSDIYTDYSSICTAAVHSGLIDFTDGGEIILEYRPGRTIYGSTVRNQIRSIASGEYSRSFVLRESTPRKE